ncbi:MvdC/MvdD family ATP grasp protein [Nonomuraea sp. B19D2]|uniref:MvdC/MvdD family ATP grasp protein n=1 Tax=Nonomuraea sp. B19D2 TaxID=3159561 RepID=UPI0032DB69CF
MSDITDAHADRLISIMRARGQKPVRLNFSDIPARASLTFRNSRDQRDGEIRILTNNQIMNLQDIGSIWWRKPISFGFPEDLDKQQQAFATEEMEHTIYGILFSLDCFWISRPDNIRNAGYKIEQLQRAARFGFEVPRTIVTTDPDAALEFYDECGGEMVYKVLSDPYLALRKLSADEAHAVPVRFVETTLIGQKELDLLDSVRVTPCQFQEKIPKRTELRVTVIGDEVFAAEIFSQEHARAAVDWRQFDLDIRYEKATLPHAITSGCLALTRSYGLNYSAIDLIHTPDDRYVFLEINPNGQFLFVEDRVPELRMAEELVSCLVHGGAK